VRKLDNDVTTAKKESSFLHVKKIYIYKTTSEKLNGTSNELDFWVLHALLFWSESNRFSHQLYILSNKITLLCILKPKIKYLHIQKL